MTCGDTLRSPPLSHKMAIWRKVTLLLFLTGTLVKPGLSTVILDQPPRTVEVHLGSSLTLNCSFMPQTRVTVNWYFSPTGHSSCSSNTLLNSSTHSADKTGKLDAGGHVSKESRESWSRLILKDVTHNNSGWYFCHVSVEIPVLQQACSNGTHVNILDNQMKSTTYTPLMTDWRLWVAVGAASAILVTLLVVIWILIQRRGCKSRDERGTFRRLEIAPKDEPDLWRSTIYFLRSWLISFDFPMMSIKEKILSIRICLHQDLQ